MKKNLKLLLLFLLPLIAVTTSCGQREEHFISDPKYREQVREKFLERRELLSGREQQLFSVFDRPDMSTAQREAMEFLYAYMPLCDLADMDGEYFLEQVDGAFRARDYFHWGRQVPEELFRHYVLIYRINNEYVDDCRDVFFDELKDRIKDMSMTEAALEVNHWCHEKVTYRATDARTSAPLALITTSWGRCGEEATFTAAAMRAVGIPARQCYTPRWVHTDSNHAWVEVWVDGAWHYLGACEPEPVLDAAWFSGPAKRAMMVHTNVPGPYFGPEEKNFETEHIARVNLLDIYTDVRKLEVTVRDRQGNPVPDARVRYKVYNYAEFTSITDAKTDADGRASLTTGYGDILLWADKDGEYGYAKNTPDSNEITVVIDRSLGVPGQEHFVMNVPAEAPATELPEELVELNRARLVYEDSVRGAYMATFADMAAAEELASRTGFKPSQVYPYLFDAQGNWREISRFIEDNKDNPLLFAFLSSMREKDLRDTPAAYLDDHLNAGTVIHESIPADLAASKILSPRIGFEIIRPWRGYLLREAGLPLEELRTGEDVRNYVLANIRPGDKDNYINCPLTPRGVHETGLADSRSRDIYFVAVCRTAGIPAHLEPASGKPQYYMDGVWHYAVFTREEVETVKPKGRLTVTSSPDNVIKPGYGTHFTVARFEDGDFQTLNYRTDPRFENLPATLDLDEGYYRIMTGSRANDGSVTVHTEYFTLGPSSPYTAEIKLPEVEGKIFVKGIIDMNTNVILNDGEKKTLKDISGGKGLILVFADPDREPTKHILQDIPAQRAELEDWAGGILFMVPDDKLSVSFDAGAFPGLPGQIMWGTDFDRELLGEAVSVLKSDFRNNFPMTLYLSSNGGVLYSSEGYRIGTGEELVKVIRSEEQTLKR